MKSTRLGTLIPLDYSFQTSKKLSPCQHDVAFTASTAYPDIRPHPVNDPGIAATGVRLFHLDTVANLNFICHKTLVYSLHSTVHSERL